jgi:glycosyltransferase involved in cell wall biosynthesis
MPRKKESDAKQVLAIARFRGILQGFNVVEIKDKTLEEYAGILRDSLIFLSFSSQEGWGLPPMEAMACGCIVLGYDGRGGAEFMRQPYALPVPAENVLVYAQTLESVLKFTRDSPKEAARLATQAAQFIHAAYPPEHERDDLLTAVRTLTARRR